MRRTKQITTYVCFAATLVVMLSSCASSSKRDAAPSEHIASIVSAASNLQGTPYCFGGTTTSCFDCSGFVSHCFATAGVVLPRTTREMYTIGQRVIDGLVVGDLVFFNTTGREVSHVGIYLGENRFVHASTSQGVIVSALTESYWQQRYLGARRLP